MTLLDKLCSLNPDIDRTDILECECPQDHFHDVKGACHLGCRACWYRPYEDQTPRHRCGKFICSKGEPKAC